MCKVKGAKRKQRLCAKQASNRWVVLDAGVFKEQEEASRAA